MYIHHREDRKTNRKSVTLSPSPPTTMYMETDFNSLGSEVNGYSEVSGYKRLGMRVKKIDFDISVHFG